MTMCSRTSTNSRLSSLGTFLTTHLFDTLILGEIFPIVDWNTMRISDAERRLVRLHVVAKVLSNDSIYTRNRIPCRCAR